MILPFFFQKKTLPKEQAHFIYSFQHNHNTGIQWQNHERKATWLGYGLS